MSEEVEPEEEITEPQQASAAQAVPSEGGGQYMPGVPMIGSAQLSEVSRGHPLAPEPTGLEYTQALGAAIARGATLGGSDPLLVGAGVKSRLLRELKAKAPLTSGLGELVGNALPLALTAGGSAPETIAGKIAEQALIGSAMGVGNEISEESLGDKEFNTEAILANGLMGGVVGGATGGLLGGLSLGAEPALRKISEATGNLGDKLQGFAEKYDSRKALEKGVGDLTDGLQKVADVQADTGRAFHGTDQDGLRYQEQDQLLQGVPHDVAQNSAKQMIHEAEMKMALMQADNVPHGPLADMQRTIGGLRDSIENSSDTSDLMSSIRDARRELRDIKKATSGTTDYGKNKALGYVNDIDQSLKSHIEDSSVYGHAGDREASINNSIAREIDATDELVSNGLARKVESLGHGAANIKFKAGAVRSLARDLVADKPEGKAKLEAIQDWVESLRGKGDEISKSAGSLPGKQAADDIRQLVLGQAKNMAELSGKTDAIQELQEALANGTGRSILGRAGHMGGIYGALSGHPGWALASLAGQAVRNPGMAIGTLAKIAKSSSRISNAISKGIGSFINSTAARGAAAEISSTISNQSWNGKRQNSIDDMQDAHTERSNQILNLASNPENLTNLITKKTGALHDAAPGIAGMAAFNISRGVQHLAGKLPPHGSPGDILPHLEAHKPSHAEVDLLERSHRVVTKPLSVLKSMKSGSLTSDEVDTLKTNYPKLYDRMATEMMGKLAALKEPLPYASRLQISTFLGKPADASLVPQNLAMLQGNYQVAQPQAPVAAKTHTNAGKVSEMKTAEASRTPFQRVAGEA